MGSEGIGGGTVPDSEKAKEVEVAYQNVNDRVCGDCGISYYISGTHAEEHPNLCCDCFDETVGVPESYRRNKRPETP